MEQDSEFDKLISGLSAEIRAICGSSFVCPLILQIALIQMQSLEFDKLIGGLSTKKCSATSGINDVAR